MRNTGVSRSADRQNRSRRKKRRVQAHVRTAHVATQPKTPPKPPGEFYDDVNLWWTSE